MRHVLGQTREVIVKYSVEYEATIEVQADQTIDDACADIDIPESTLSYYLPESFEVHSVMDVETGEDVCDDDEDKDEDFDDDEF